MDGAGADGVSWIPANGFDGAACANDRGADGLSWIPANGLDDAGGVVGAAVSIDIGTTDGVS